MINAIELKKIADYLSVKMDELTRMPEFNSENELLTESREGADRKFLEEIKASFERFRGRL